MLHTVCYSRPDIFLAHAVLEGHIDADVISVYFELFNLAHHEAPNSTQYYPSCIA